MGEVMDSSAEDIADEAVADETTEESVTEINLRSTLDDGEFSGTARKVSLVDLNLMRGSSDLIRNNLGGFFFNQKDSFGVLQVPPAFYKFVPIDPPSNDYIYSAVSYIGPVVNLTLEDVTGAGGVATITADTAEAVSRGSMVGGDIADYFQDTMIPYVQFICRLHGDPEHAELRDVMSGNKYWQKLFTGGEYLYDTVNPIYNEGVYDDHFITTTFPYPNIQKQYLKSAPDMTNFIECGYEYSNYLRDYQEYTANISSELQIPNWYVLNLVAYTPDIDTSAAADTEVTVEAAGTPDLSKLNPNVYKKYTFNGYLTIEDMKTYLELMVTGATGAMERDYPTIETPTSPKTPSWEIPLTRYLNVNTIVSSSLMSASVQNYCQQRYRHVLFNSNATTSFLKETADANRNIYSLPYSIKINFPTLTSGKVCEMIADNGMDTLLMRTLKEHLPAKSKMSFL